MHSQKYLTFPRGFDVHCKSLVRRLLHPNAALRLGALQNGIEDIRTHAFFAVQNVDFDKLLAQEVPMEYTPPSAAAPPATPPGAIDGFDLDRERSAVGGDDYGGFFNALHFLDATTDVIDVMEM